MVGSAVATMVWSRAARAMPSMRAPRITRIRAVLGGGGFLGAGRLLDGTFIDSSGRRLRHGRSSRSRFEIVGEPAEKIGQGGQVVVVPTLQELVEPGPAGPPHPIERPPSGRGEADPRGPAILRVGLTDDHLFALELLDLAGHRRGVDPEQLGQVGDPERVAPG